MTERRTSLALAALLSIPLSLTLLVLAECARVPAVLYAHAPLRACWLLLHGGAQAVRTFAPDVAFQLGLVVVAASATLERRTRARSVVLALMSAVPVAWAYGVLVGDPVFMAYLPLIAGWVALWIYVVACAFTLLRPPPPTRASVWLTRSLVLGGVLGSVVAQAANVQLLVDDYPTVHSAALQAAHLVLQAGLTLGLLPLARRICSRVRVFPALAGVMLALAGFAALHGRLPERSVVEPSFLAHTTLGRGTLTPGSELEPVVARSVVVPKAAALFATHGHLPTLPQDFRLADYDVLFITAEATRFDQTSLADPERKTTPKLLRWAVDTHAFSFTRAYSPASSTGQSMASVFNMTFPSAVPYEVWRKRWRGELSRKATTVPELFRAARRNTFWVGHNYLGLFGGGIVGLQQGFREVKLVPAGHESARTDASIASLAARSLRSARKQHKPFFGWVFFVSPHGPYLTHGYAMPGKTSLDRYRQELRYLDDQLARLLTVVDGDASARPTIVMFMGDHGEQFGEHGGSDHSRNVYTESIHVPLLVRIPGLRGGARTEPVSTTYLFPWLLQRGDARMRKAARTRITRELAPLLQTTGGAVVSELLGNDRMLATVVHQESKVDYDFMTGAYEAYDLKADPGEQRDLTQTDPRRAAAMRPALDAFRQLRAATRRFTLAPTRSRESDR